MFKVINFGLVLGLMFLYPCISNADSDYSFKLENNQILIMRKDLAKDESKIILKGNYKNSIADLKVDFKGILSVIKEKISNKF